MMRCIDPVIPDRVGTVAWVGGSTLRRSGLLASAPVSTPRKARGRQRARERPRAPKARPGQPAPTDAGQAEAISTPGGPAESAGEWVEAGSTATAVEAGQADRAGGPVEPGEAGSAAAPVASGPAGRAGEPVESGALGSPGTAVASQRAGRAREPAESGEAGSGKAGSAAAAVASGPASRGGKAVRSGGEAGQPAKTGRGSVAGKGPARSGGGRPGKGTVPPGGERPGKGRPAKGKPLPAPPGPGLVVGPVPARVRIAGGIALAGAVLRLLAPAFPLARSNGRELGAAGNVLDFVPPLPLVGVVLAAAALCVRGRLPRLGLAALLSAGTLSAGLLLRTLALLDTGTRTTVDLPLGIGTSARYQVGDGLVLLVLAYGLLAVAALVAALAWPRTLMEDEGGFDRRRPRVAAWGLLVGVFAALVLGMSPYSSVSALTPPTLPERAGLDLLGGLLLALGAAAWAVLAATLRPRLAVVGAYAGLSAVLATEGLATLLLVARSPAVDASAGGIGTLLAALALLALAVSAALRRG